MTVISLGISESVNPETLDTVILDKEAPERESIFWERVIILTLPSVREDKLERELEREAN